MYKKTVRILFFGVFLSYVPMAHAEIFNRTSPKNNEIFNSQSSKPQNREETPESASKTNTERSSANTKNNTQGRNNGDVHNEVKPAPPANVYPYYIDAAKYCSYEWSSQECMKTLSSASLVMVSNYAEDLHESGNGEHLESLKQHCAASTAGTKVEVPAYAQRSAFVECINHIVTINEKTGVKPNADFYQLMVGAIMCFDKSQSCIVIEQSLDSVLAAHNAK